MVSPLPVADFDDLERITSEDFDDLKRKTARPQPRQFTRRQFMLMGGLAIGSTIAAALGITFAINPDLFGPRYLTFKEYYALKHKHDHEGNDAEACERIDGYAIGDTLYIKDTVFSISSRNSLPYQTIHIFCESYVADLQKHDGGLSYDGHLIFSSNRSNPAAYRAAMELKKGYKLIFTSPIADKNELINDKYPGLFDSDDCKGIPSMDHRDILGRNTLRKVT